MQTRIGLHAEIHCDGGQGGHLEGVVLDPERRRVVHLVIRAPDGHRHVVAPAAIAEAHRGELKLALTVSELLATPRFLERDLSPPAAPAPPAPLDRAEVLHPVEADRSVVPLGEQPQPVEHVAVPPGMIALVAGETVHCTDMACGHLAEVVLDPATAHAEGMLVRRGFLWAQDVELPLGWLDHVDEAGVHLKMSAHQVTELARYFPRTLE